MSTSKHIDKICIAIVAVALVITVLFMNGAGLGIASYVHTMGYENRLFDTSKVHTIDIVMDDWDEFIEGCESEEYSTCAAVIDGESFKNIGIRAKGNTSLSNVSSLGSQRYSFKIEFDQYEDNKTYHGLDKLCLNNLIQDNTMMKDYIVYQMMNDFDVDSPLCSFVYITINGEDWGLYLAVEGIEDSFLERNYGSDTGDLYKPDSMSFGGGRGNGKSFNMDDFDFGDSDEETESETKTDTKTDTKTNTGDRQEPATSADAKADTESTGSKAQMMSLTATNNGSMPQGGMQGGMQGGNPPEMPSGDSGSMTPPDGFDGEMPSGNFGDMTPPDGSDGTVPEMPSDNNNNNESTTSDNSEASSEPADSGNESTTAANEDADSSKQNGDAPEMPDGDSNSKGDSKGGGMGGGMGSDDVKLNYIDDDPDSYSNIFDNAKTDVTDEDQERLISSLKSLSEYTDLEDVLDMEEVLRYFVVHNFVCNGDSYTGSMIHNYYLHESDGKLGMIPWDYNLAFGTFQGGDASGTVNTSIDSPVSGGDMDDRPMVGWIFSDDSYTEQYHELFEEFIEKWFTDGELVSMIEETADLISSYVEKDPTKFCTTEEFEAGVEALSQFVTLRGEAVSNQLNGDTTTVDTGDLNLSDMGTMSNGGGGNMPDMGSFDASSFITLKDVDGNEVEITSIIEDITSIVSLTLSDGTVIEISDDMKDLISTDLSDVVSATDKDGKVYDLSKYTISITMPSMGGGFGGKGDDSNTDASDGGEADGQQSAQGDDANSTPPEKPDGDDSSAEPPEKPDGDNGSFSFPGGGNSDSSSEGGDSEGRSMPDMKDFDGEMPDDFDGKMPDGAEGQGTTDGTVSTQTWILVGVSALILAIGLIFVIKKKY